MLYKFSCIFNSLTFGVDMKYMSMLDILEANLLRFLSFVWVQQEKRAKQKKDKKTLSTFVSLFAFVLLLSVFFPTRTRVVQLFKRKLICLHAMNAKQILYIHIYIYMKKNTVLLYHVLKWHQKEASTTSTWFFTWWSEMPNKLRVPNSSASRYEYSLNIINHCHLSECKWKTFCNFCN